MAPCGASRLARNPVHENALSHPRIKRHLRGSRLDEKALFHLLNLAREQESWLLLTARMPPASWPIALPDLRSRALALPMVEIGHPDDRLLHLVLVKLLSDQQLATDPGVVDYLSARMERSLGTARSLVGCLDRLSLEHARPITRALAAEALDEVQDRSDYS